MNVSLTPELEEFIAELVESGQYRSASEAVRAGIRLLQERAQLHELKLAALKRELEEGIADLDARRSVEGESMFERLLGASKPLRFFSRLPPRLCSASLSVPAKSSGTGFRSTRRSRPHRRARGKPRKPDRRDLRYTH